MLEKLKNNSFRKVYEIYIIKIQYAKLIPVVWFLYLGFGVPFDKSWSLQICYSLLAKVAVSEAWFRWSCTTTLVSFLFHYLIALIWSAIDQKVLKCITFFSWIFVCIVLLCTHSLFYEHIPTMDSPTYQSLYIN